MTDVRPRGRRRFGPALAFVVAAAMPCGTLERARAAEPIASGKATMDAPSKIYRPAAFADLAGWDGDDHLAAYKAFIISCRRLAAVAGGVTKTRVVPPLDLVAVCRTALAAAEIKTKVAAKAFFERHFAPHAVANAGPAGLLTGYYEPVLAGSRAPTPKFRVAVHRRPPDLVNLVDETERSARSQGLSHARQTEKGIAPFATRAEIDQGALDGRGLELIYLADAVDKFFMQIQGSGRIRLPDGTMLRVTYDGKNGHPYTSIGRHLIDQNIIPADRMSLDALGDWLRANPEIGRQVMWQNRSYVFFRELSAAEAAGPLGALDIPLTEGRSLAVDTAYHALGLPVFVTAPTLEHAAGTGKFGFRRLMIAQDVGSAIKGPERGDIYFGSGAAAGRRAGTTKHPGTFHVLLPKPGVATPQLRSTE